jgi:hypothetical protein
MDSLLALHFEWLNITDISALSGLHNLSVLWIVEPDGNETKIADYTPIFNLTNLGRYTARLDEALRWNGSLLHYSFFSTTGRDPHYLVILNSDFSWGGVNSRELQWEIIEKLPRIDHSNSRFWHGQG